MKFLRSIGIFLLFILFVSFNTSAQQAAGGEISYKWISGDTYQITVAIYTKCPNSSSPNQIVVSYKSSVQGNATNLNFSKSGGGVTIPACAGATTACAGGTGEGADALVKWTYVGTITFPSKAADWEVFTQTPSTTSLTTVSGISPPMYLTATINNTGNLNNSSVVYSSNPISFYNQDQAVTYDPGLTATDGDQLKVSLISPKRTGQTDISYDAPYSATQPISTTGSFGINATTGVLNFTPSHQGDVSVMAIQVQEVRNGVVIGSTMREMYLQTLGKLDSPPYFTDPTTQYCVASTSSTIPITITGLTNIPGANVNIIWNNKAEWGKTSADSGSSFRVIKSSGSATFSLSYKAASLPFSKVINLTVLDDKCGKITKSFTITASQMPIVSLHDTTVLCLKPFSVTAKVSGGTAPYTYVWSDPQQTTNTITISAVGTYTLKVTDAKNCTSNTASMKVISPINFDIGAIACADSVVTFYDISKGNLTVPSTYPPTRANPQTSTTTWTWDFGDGTQSTTNTPTPTHKYSKAGTYPVKMTVSDGKGCTNNLTLNTKIYGRPQASFIQTDQCVNTERSDLKVQDAVIADTSYSTTKMIYTVTNPLQKVSQYTSMNPAETPLHASIPGQYIVQLKVTDDAGCMGTFTDTLKVLNKPVFIQTPRRGYYYRCDSPGFPDTVLSYRATPVGDARSKSNTLNVTIQRISGDISLSDSLLPSFTGGNAIQVPFHIVQNKQINQVTIQTVDANGCTNDTSTNFIIPMDSAIQLTKYYCHVNDTLELADKGTYHWGLAASSWDMKDGKTPDTTNGFVRHVYDSSAKSIDQATVVLHVTDKTGCTASASFQVYLSEPDTNQFQIIKPMACVADTVHINGIQDPYINSWYYRYQSGPDSVVLYPDAVVSNTAFGTTVPAGVNTVKFFGSKTYIATTGVFYNEPSSFKNFGTPQVCYTQVSRRWKIVDTMNYAISNNYDHCYDSLKLFTAELKSNSSETQLDTANWVWSLYSPSNVALDSAHISNQTGLTYEPDKSLFTQVATSRAIYNNDPNPAKRYLPYVVKVKYRYKSDTIYCTGSASMKVDNEKVQIVIDTTHNLTCVNYTNTYLFNTLQFLDGIDSGDSTISEKANTLWDYGDSVLVNDYPGTVRYDKPQTYNITAYATNYYGCKASSHAVVTVKPSPTAAFTVGPVCYGKQTVLDASASTAATSSSIADYYWFFSNPIPFGADSTQPDTLKASVVTKDSIITENFPVGSNPVGLAVKDINGCFDTTQVKFAPVYVLPKIDFTAITKLNNDEDYLGNEPIEFTPISSNVSYFRWNMGNGTIIVPTGDTTGAIEYTYPYYTVPPYKLSDNIYDVQLFVSTKDGCIDSVHKKIDVNAYFELPNAFSPNDDGLHDQLLGVGKGIKEIKEFKIFNRWGETIYSVTGKPDRDALKRGYLLWDGSYNGQTQPVGAYVYYAVVTTGYGNDIIRKGNLTLVK